MKKNKASRRKSQSKSRKSKKKATPRKVWLNVLPDDVWIRVKRGSTVYSALQNTEIELEMDCAGLGKCG